ncbi:MAG TPA: DUF4157 domain-containing protein [Anaerolineae bacterium]|nr:DUF4157 domain-containing protein [Anaerolineae bacterium]
MEKARHQLKPSATSSVKASGFLQRRCACGGTPGLDGDCAECRRKRLQRQRSDSGLRVGPADDRFEHEAEQWASAALRGQLPGPVQQAAPELRRAPVEQIIEVPLDEEEARRRSEEAGDELIQAQAEPGQSLTAPPGVSRYLAQARGGGQAIPPVTRFEMEHRFGHDFSRVRIHADGPAAQAARAVHAQAFTVGGDIVFAAGQYAPASPAGRHLLAHELVHTIQQGAAPARGAGTLAGRAQPVAQPMLQRTRCNFYVYDSTESGALGTAWAAGARAAALGAWGGYAIASGKSIETMIKRVIAKYKDEDCDCIEEIQFWSHGSSGNGMWISGEGDEFTTADFNIPDLDKHDWRDVTYYDIAANTAKYQSYKKWYDGLSTRQQSLVELRDRLCSSGAEVYYRSCEAFQGKQGQEFAKASASFWRSKVIGHTKVIGLSQPGQKSLKPGQEPTWSETEGVGDVKFKKEKTKGHNMPK